MSESLLDLETLASSWLITLRGERKSPATLRAYQAGIDAYFRFCAENGVTPPVLDKRTVREFMASLADSEPATSRLRLTAIKLYARWLAAEEGFDADGVLTVRAPKLDQKAVADLSADEIKRLLKACGGTGLLDRRDHALVALFVETGLRGGEMVALDVPHVDVLECTATVVRGKGAKGRRVKFSPTTAAIVDRYLRARRSVTASDSGPLWLTAQGKRLSFRAMSAALGRRAVSAGIEGFHPHRLRHSAAVQWLRRGGTEAGLMAQSGWASRVQIDRYIKTASEQLAAEEFDRLGLGVDEL